MRRFNVQLKWKEYDRERKRERIVKMNPMRVASRPARSTRSLLLASSLVAAFAACSQGACGGNTLQAPQKIRETPNKRAPNAGASTHQTQTGGVSAPEKRSPSVEIRSAMLARNYQQALDLINALQVATIGQQYTKARAQQLLGDSAAANQTFRAINLAELPEATRSVAARRAADAAGNAPDCEAFHRFLESQADLPRRHPHTHAACSGNERASLKAAKQTARIRLRRVELAMEASDTTEANELKRRLITYDAGTPQARKIGRDPAYGPRPKLDRHGKATRIASLYRRRQFAAVLAMGSPSSKQSRATRARWLHARGMSQYRTKAYRDAAKTLSSAARLRGNTETQDAFHAARALSRSGQSVAADKAYQRVISRYSASRWASKAAHLRHIAALHSNRTGARRNALKSLRQPTMQPIEKRELVFEIAFSDLLANQPKRARLLLQSNQNLFPDQGMHLGRNLYWQGVAFERDGDSESAVARWKSTIEVEPLHWYGQLAAKRLSELRSSVRPFDANNIETSRPSIELPPAAAFFSQFGLVDDAADAIGSSRLSKQQKALAYLTVGAEQKAYQLARGKRFKSAPDSESLTWWHAAYPQPFEGMVADATKRWQVDPAYVYASMRQESGYKPTARSGAGAVGLLQLMPATARHLFDRANINPARRNDGALTQADINIPLGVLEMSDSLKRYDGASPLALAGYNAGHHRVREWLGRFAPARLDFFVEQIPYQETRNYVRRVTSHHAHYRFLRTPNQPWPQLPTEIAQRYLAADVTS